MHGIHDVLGGAGCPDPFTDEDLADLKQEIVRDVTASMMFGAQPAPADHWALEAATFDNPVPRTPARYQLIHREALRAAVRALKVDAVEESGYSRVLHPPSTWPTGSKNSPTPHDRPQQGPPGSPGEGSPVESPVDRFEVAQGRPGEGSVVHRSQDPGRHPGHRRAVRRGPEPARGQYALDDGHGQAAGRATGRDTGHGVEDQRDPHSCGRAGRRAGRGSGPRLARGDLAGDSGQGEGGQRRGALRRPGRDPRGPGHRPHLGRAGADSGCPPYREPVLRERDVRDQHKGRMHFMVFTESFDAKVICRFLARLVGHFDRKVHLIVNRHSAHRSKAVRA